MEWIMIAAGIGLLFLGGKYLLDSSVALAQRLAIPRVVIGLTIVSFATSAPELIVSINAALSGASAIALGNVVGSNIANIGLVLGLILVLAPIKAESTFYKMDWPAMMLISLLLAVFLIWNIGLSRWEGGGLLLFLVLFMVYLIRKQKGAEKEEVVGGTVLWPYYKIILLLSLSGFALWLGSEWLVTNASSIALKFGVSQRVIALSVVAIGTSIPELTASLVAIFKGEKGISLGNVVGSNIFNIGSVLGITALISPIPVEDSRFVGFDIYVLLAFALVLLPMILLPKRLHLTRYEGALLLLMYFGFMYMSF